MAVAFRRKSAATTTERPSAEIVAPPARAIRQAEAPDRGLEGREAPEHRTARHTEAPDAGEGRAALLEHEFTHGRSQS